MQDPSVKKNSILESFLRHKGRGSRSCAGYRQRGGQQVVGTKTTKEWEIVTFTMTRKFSWNEQASSWQSGQLCTTSLRMKRERGGDCDPAIEQKIINRNVVRQQLRIKHLQNPVSALTEGLRRVEEWEEADSSTAGGSSA